MARSVWIKAFQLSMMILLLLLASACTHEAKSETAPPVATGEKAAVGGRDVAMDAAASQAPASSALATPPVPGPGATPVPPAASAGATAAPGMALGSDSAPPKASAPTAADGSASSGGAGGSTPATPASAAPPTDPAAPAAGSEVPAETKEEDAVTVIGDDKLGTVLGAYATPVKEGDTVLTVLQKAAKANKIPVDYSGRGITAFVKGIDNLYQFDRGSKSGWLFRVNGKFPDEGAGAYKVKPGDRVEWLYTLNLGKDVGAKP